MCGIVGYIGDKDCVPILTEGLRRLEYRGYDSAGLAVNNGKSIITKKCAGRVENLQLLIEKDKPQGHNGISHTRWATHGIPSDENAHPHFDQSGKIVLVHNGVIENYNLLKDKLLELGHNFKSETDSEVLAHLIGHHYENIKSTDTDSVQDRLVTALKIALSEVSGTYGIILSHTYDPELIIGARLGSPLILGIGENENLLSSDVSAIVTHTQQVIYLNDYDIVAVRKNNFEIFSMREKASQVEISTVDQIYEKVDKGKFPHFMLKEIYEQPEAIENALRGRLVEDEANAQLGGLNMTPRELREIDRIILSGCGTAYNSALVGEYIMEAVARIPTEVEIASELRYRNLPLGRGTLQFIISQSGETIDSLAALREGQRKGARVLGICNNVASTIARESDGGVYMHAGPEIGVAATKTYTSQVTILMLISLLFGRMHHLSYTEGKRIVTELKQIPDKVRQILQMEKEIKKIAEKYTESEGMLFLGRLANFPTALEGALKLKEISYIHASGHPSAELKHGIIALVNEKTPSVFIAPDDSIYEKNVSNIQEVKARSGKVIAVTTEGKKDMEKIADDVIYIPQAPHFINPILSIIPLQLFAYHLAVALGKDVDKPRNLAKSVTVE